MKWIVSIAFVALLTVGYFSTGIVIIPRIGAVPEGKTVWMWRLNGSPFLETPDAWCRRNDQPNLLCRAMFLGSIADNKDKILGRFTHSQSLEDWANREVY